MYFCIVIHLAYTMNYTIISSFLQLTLERAILILSFADGLSMSRHTRRSYRLPTVFQVRSAPGSSASQKLAEFFCLYAIPENVGIVPCIVKVNIFASFLAVLVCHIEWLLIADTTDNL